MRALDDAVEADLLGALDQLQIVAQMRRGVARRMLAADDQAEPLFTAALAEDLAGYPYLRARTLFSFGRWLRRQRRSADSRSPLRESVALFDALGAAAWSRRARQELRATGEKVGRRAPDLRDRLTAQELQIAQLAAEGLSKTYRMISYVMVS